LISRVVAFDFDGVIADSLPPQEVAWREALSAISPAVDGEIVQHAVRNLWAGHAGERMFDGLDLTPEQRRQARRKKDRIWSATRDSVPLVEGAREALRSLPDAFELFVATTAARAYVLEVLEREGLDHLFTAIVTDDDLAHPKPHPEMLMKIAHEAGVEISDLLFVGDSETDLEMAEAAGCPFILLDVRARWSHVPPAARVARSWQELRRILANSLPGVPSPLGS